MALRETHLYSFPDGAAPASSGSPLWSGLAGNFAWRVDGATLGLARGGASEPPERVALPGAPVAPPLAGRTSIVVPLVSALALVRVGAGSAGGVAALIAVPPQFGRPVALSWMPDGGDSDVSESVLVGFDSGAVGRASFAAERFDPFPSRRTLSSSTSGFSSGYHPVPMDAENTSVVSASTHGPGGDNSMRDPQRADLPRRQDADVPPPEASHPSTPSFRSAASSISRGFFMNRLFGRSGADDGAAEASNAYSDSGRRGGSDSHHNARSDQLSTRKHGSRTPQIPADPIYAVLCIQLSVPVAVTLHQSGRICAYAPAARETYILAGETSLPATLVHAPHSTSNFLLASENGCVLVVATVDCDPQPHAVHVYSLLLNMNITRGVSFVWSLLVRRNGPLDRLNGAGYIAALPAVGATPFPSGCVVLGTEVGRVFAFDLSTNLLSEEALDGTPSSGTGIPENTLWTIDEDTVSPLGLWSSYDMVQPDLQCRLFGANRFSAEAIAKALRVPELYSAVKSDLEGVAARVVSDAADSGESDDAIARRLLQRCQRSAYLSDFPLLSISHVPGIGIVLSRRRGISVLRPMSQSESLWFQLNNVNLLSFRNIGSVDPVRTSDGFAFRGAISSQTVTQMAAADFRANPDASAERKRAACILSLGLRTSSLPNYVSIAELAFQYASEVDDGSLSQTASYDTLSETVKKWMVPGPNALLFLHASGELSSLDVATQYCVDSLPISCLFAMGIVFLSRRADNGGDEDERMGVYEVDGEENGTSGVNMSATANAYTSFVSAARVAATQDVWNLKKEDADTANQYFLVKADRSCVAELAEVEQAPARRNISDTWGESTTIFPNLEFWLLERALRLLESSGATKTAAALALEALSLAPDSSLYEMMRAAAFRRFLDCGDLECALQTLLKSPFEGKKVHTEHAASEESACAMRDCIGLLVNACIDAGRFGWLLHADLPPPAKELAALALERRARSSEMFARDQMLQECQLSSENSGYDPGRLQRLPSPYEYLFVWQLGREDFSGAAACAMEWYERIASEGLAETKALAATSGGSLVCSPLMFLYSWANMKSRSLAAACSAVRRLPAALGCVRRSRHSIAARYTVTEESEGVVDLAWLSRRHLLSRAQLMLLTKRISDGKVVDSNGAMKVPSTEYVISQSDFLLGDEEKGVNFALSSLLVPPAVSKNVYLALDLALQWRSEPSGEVRLLEVVRAAGALSFLSPSSKSDQGVSGGLDRELDKLLGTITMVGRDSTVSQCRNWYLVAVQGALEASGGTAGLPGWLTNAAAFGSGSRQETVPFESGDRGGDLGGLVRLLLRYGRVMDAAQLLILGLHECVEAMKNSSSRDVHIPYSCIDATLGMLEVSSDVESSRLRLNYLEELRNLTANLSRPDRVGLSDGNT